MPDYSAHIDLRFDQPNDFTVDRLLVNSFENVKKTVDRIYALGFDSVDITTNVPINVVTGELQLTTPAGTYNTDKSLPKDIWKIVDYAKGLGLKVNLELNIVDPITDRAIGVNPKKSIIPPASVFFNSVKSYETMIAKLAQTHKVDEIIIGKQNSFFENASYASDWQNVISSIRQVYTGKLGYTSTYEFSNNAIWGLVDVVHMVFNPVLSTTPLYDPEQIIPSYFRTQDSSGSKNAYDLLLQQVNKYQSKEVKLSNLAFSPAQNAVGTVINLSDYLWGSGTSAASTSYKATSANGAGVKIDNEIMQAWITSFFEFVGNYLKDKIDGVSFDQYAPWTEANWIQAPGNQIKNQAYNTYVKSNFFLNHMPSAEDVISKYISQDWGWHTLYYGTSGSDTLVGNTGDDRLLSLGGSDYIIGAGGRDTAVFKFANTNSVSKNLQGHHIITHGADKTKVVSVERLEFANTSVAIDIDGNAGTIAKLLGAVFGKSAVSNKEYVGIGLDLLDQGLPAKNLAAAALRLAHADTPDQIVSLVWKNIVGSAPSAENKAALLPLLDTMSTGEFAMLAADTALNIQNINLVGLATTGIEYTPIN